MVILVEFVVRLLIGKIPDRDKISTWSHLQSRNVRCNDADTPAVLAERRVAVVEHLGVAVRIIRIEVHDLLEVLDARERCRNAARGLRNLWQKTLVGDPQREPLAEAKRTRVPVTSIEHLYGGDAVLAGREVLAFPGFGGSG